MRLHLHRSSYPQLSFRLSHTKIDILYLNYLSIISEIVTKPITSLVRVTYASTLGVNW